ncbi:MAG: V-type ATP synthase subunit F [Candidatus Bathyarchaeia archaeon]
MRVALIADKNTATCFKVAGLKEVYSVKSAEEAEKSIHKFLEEGNFTIVLVTERIVNQIHDVLEKIMERKDLLIIPIPDIRGSIKLKTDLIVELIRRKTGIEVKLQ